MEKDRIVQRMSALYLAASASPEVGRSYLPDWWEDEIVATDAGLCEGLLYVSRASGIDYATLRERFNIEEGNHG